MIDFWFFKNILNLSAEPSSFGIWKHSNLLAAQKEIPQELGKYRFCVKRLSWFWGKWSGKQSFLCGLNVDVCWGLAWSVSDFVKDSDFFCCHWLTCHYFMHRGLMLWQHSLQIIPFCLLLRTVTVQVTTKCQEKQYKRWFDSLIKISLAVQAAAVLGATQSKK